MRYMKWSLLFWLVSAPLFYVFGLPILMEKLQTKARAETVLQCQVQLKEQNIAYTPLSVVKPDVGDRYCSCLSGGLTLQQADLPELVQHRQPVRLETEMKGVVEACNHVLQDAMNQTLSQTPPAPIVVAPINTTKEADGSETVTFN